MSDSFREEGYPLNRLKRSRGQREKRSQLSHRTWGKSRPFRCLGRSRSIPKYWSKSLSGTKFFNTKKKQKTLSY